MKIKSLKPLDSGRVRLVVDLEQDEEIKVIKENAYYQLGGQLEDVVSSHVLSGTSEVYWCSVSQSWKYS